MKNLLRNISWANMEQQLSDMVSRFPLTVVCIFGVFMVGLYMVHADYSDTSMPFKIILAMLLGIWISVSAQLATESYDANDTKRTALLVAVAGIVVAYFLSLPGNLNYVSNDFFVFQLLLHGALFSSMLFSYFLAQLRAGEYQNEYWYGFTLTSALYVVQAAITALMLFVLGAATLGTIDVLFELSFIEGERYAEWALFSFALIAPLYLLTLLPKNNREGLQVGEKFLHFLLRYVAVPFVAIYMLILYAYAVKVLLNFSQWPQGVVSWLVIWFSFFGFLTYVLSYHIRYESYVAMFRKWFPILLLPQLAMLFYAIALRISQHGLTMNRYFVVLFGLWIAFIALYFVLRKNKAKLVMLPASLFVGMLLISFGPWSIFALPVSSQLVVLEKNLNSLEMTQGGEVFALEGADLNDKQKNLATSANSIIKYVCENHGCKNLVSVLGKEIVGETKASSYIQAEEINKSLGLENYYYIATFPGRETNYVNLYFNQDEESINIKGYDNLIQFSSWGESKEGTAYYNLEEGTLTLFSGKTASINAQVQELFENNKNFVGASGEVPARDMFVIVEEQNWKIYFWNISGENTNGTVKVRNAGGVVLYNK